MTENFIRLDLEHTRKFAGNHEIGMMAPYIEAAHEAIVNRTGAGSEFLGWVDLPDNYDKDEFERIKEAARAINGHSDVLVVIGIGGSYLGAKAALEMLNPT